MLTPEKVEHGLRAAAEILGTRELVLIGSATALIGGGRFTLRMARSNEIDTYSPDPKARGSDALEVIGVASRFYDTYKFYVDGVTPETARMPSDWRGRATTSALRTDPSINVVVPELNDVALSKMIAWREKDIGWLEDATVLGRIDPVAMAARIDRMPLHRIEAPSEELNRRLQVLARYAGPRAVAALEHLPSEPSGPALIRAGSLASADRAPVERMLKALRANDLNVRVADTLAALAADASKAERYALDCGLRIAGEVLNARGFAHPNEAITAELDARLAPSTGRVPADSLGPSGSGRAR